MSHTRPPDETDPDDILTADLFEATGLLLADKPIAVVLDVLANHVARIAASANSPDDLLETFGKVTRDIMTENAGFEDSAVKFGALH